MFMFQLVSLLFLFCVARLHGTSTYVEENQTGADDQSLDYDYDGEAKGDGCSYVGTRGRKVAEIYRA